MYVVVMVLHRLEPSSKYIEGKAYALAGSESWYNEFVFLTSCTALRSATSVDAALEVAL